MFLFFIFSFSVLRKSWYIFSSSAANSKNHTNMEIEERNKPDSMQNLDDIDVDSILGETAPKKEDAKVVEEVESTMKSDSTKDEVVEIHSPKRIPKELKETNNKRTEEVKPKHSVSIAKKNNTKNTIVLRSQDNRQGTLSDQRMLFDLIKNSSETALTSAYFNDFKRILLIRRGYNKEIEINEFMRKKLEKKITEIRNNTDYSEGKESYINMIEEKLGYGFVTINPEYYHSIRGMTFSISMYDKSTAKGGDVYIIKKKYVRAILNAAFPGEWMATYHGTIKYGPQFTLTDLTLENIEMIRKKQWSIHEWNMTCTIHFGLYGREESTVRMNDVPFGGKLTPRNLFESFLTYAIRNTFTKIFPMTMKHSSESSIGKYINSITNTPSGIGISVCDYDDFLQWGSNTDAVDVQRYLEGGDNLWNGISQQTIDNANIVQGIHPHIEEVSDEEN